MNILTEMKINTNVDMRIQQLPLTDDGLFDYELVQTDFCNSERYDEDFLYDFFLVDYTHIHSPAVMISIMERSFAIATKACKDVGLTMEQAEKVLDSLEREVYIEQMYESKDGLFALVLSKYQVKL